VTLKKSLKLSKRANRLEKIMSQVMKNATATLEIYSKIQSTPDVDSSRPTNESNTKSGEASTMHVPAPGLGKKKNQSMEALSMSQITENQSEEKES